MFVLKLGGFFCLVVVVGGLLSTTTFWGLFFGLGFVVGFIFAVRAGCAGCHKQMRRAS